MNALVDAPDNPKACFVFAHGAGAGMKHPFMSAVAKGLVERGIATLRYEFPYMERGSRRVDPPAVAQAALRAACAEAAKRFAGVPLFAGGKSFGGRMTSQAQADSPLEDVLGVIFLGFPLHPPGKPSNDRAAHLSGVKIPMLFLQGERDEFAQLPLLRPLIEQLGELATLRLFDHADHSFHVPARSGRKDAEVMAGVLDAMAGWIAGKLPPTRP